MLLGLAVIAGVSGCKDKSPFHATDLTGSSIPDLKFTMTRATDGKVVTAADYKGKVVLLYFGYTYCPDVCPLTLANTVQVLQKLGDDAQKVRVLFVTVDPDRDTLPVLKDYTSAFSPQVDGLRGTPDQIAALAKRYRVAYSVKKSKTPSDYVVTHSSAIYAFAPDGKVRLLITTLSGNDPTITETADDLRHIIDEDGSSGPLAWLGSLI